MKDKYINQAVVALWEMKDPVFLELDPHVGLKVRMSRVLFCSFFLAKLAKLLEILPMVVCQSVGPSLGSSFHSSQIVNPSDFVAPSATTRLTLMYYLCHEI